MAPSPPADGEPLTGVRLDLAYDGTSFKGWARQPDQRTVQGELERALTTVLRHRIAVSVAGRTDAGVHAEAQVASFTTAAARLEPERLRLALSALLPPEIAVNAVAAVAPGFDARAARARTYRSRVWLPDVRPVFERLYVWDVRGPLDPGLLGPAADLLVGRRDFSALTPSARFYRTCRREVHAARWHLEHDDREAVFEITSDSFLHNMVRVAVGTMVDVAQGRMPLAAMADGLERGERRHMGQTAPARGLALVAVEY
jgi:tRNA pseudouridine38-40 synthase